MKNLYKQAVDILTSQGKFHICLGLDRVTKVLNLLGNPQDNLKVIHVAGTNGKGSVCAMLSSVLKEAGYNVGLYTSPHLMEYTERIKINNVDITEEEFAHYIMDICNIADKNKIHLTEFEILTVLMYKYFFEKKVDIAIVETGLGGRLDATNVIKSNMVSVITSISLDHVDRLGNTIEEIAYEKAGIIKNNCELVVSDKNLGHAVIKKVAEEKKVSINNPKNNVELQFENGVNYALFDSIKTEFALLGLCQKDNLEIVLEVIDVLNNKSINISQEALRSGLKNVVWPARMQYIKEKNILIDGSHNVDGARKLAESLDFYFPHKKRMWIYGSLKTKDYKNITNILFRPDDEVYVYKFDNISSIHAEDIKLYKKERILSLNISKAENILNYYDNNCLKIISGSFYMIGEILNTLKN